MGLCEFGMRNERISPLGGRDQKDSTVGFIKTEGD